MLAEYEAVQLMNRLFPNGDSLVDMLMTRPLNSYSLKPKWEFEIGDQSQMVYPLIMDELSGSSVDELGLITHFRTIYCKLFPAKV